MRPPRRELFEQWGWQGIDITAEARDARAGMRTVHERVVEVVLGRHEQQGWVLCDDGANELADHVVILPDAGGIGVDVHLLHSKYSTEVSPGVRSADIDVVVQQALRSRRFVNNARTLWREIARRLHHRASTRVLTAPPYGMDELLEHAERWAHASPLVRTHYHIVQPGFSIEGFFRGLETADEHQRPAALLNTLMAAEALLGRDGATLRFVGALEAFHEMPQIEHPDSGPTAAAHGDAHVRRKTEADGPDQLNILAATQVIPGHHAATYPRGPSGGVSSSVENPAARAEGSRVQQVRAVIETAAESLAAEPRAAIRLLSGWRPRS